MLKSRVRSHLALKTSELVSKILSSAAKCWQPNVSHAQWWKKQIINIDNQRAWPIMLYYFQRRIYEF